MGLALPVDDVVEDGEDYGVGGEDIPDKFVKFALNQNYQRYA